MMAAQEGHLSVVELLVSVGAQVNNQDNVSHASTYIYLIESKVKNRKLAVLRKKKIIVHEL